ncbi:MAG: helix-turn-helix transcriptional regulator [Eubacteriales bacterium]|nr:helix-turn-helix transcriptional regulator [Eubacteriales bacterium]
MLNENIKALRKAKGLSQEELAIKLNVVRQTVSKWEKGLSVPDAGMVIQIAEVLDTTVNILLGEEIPSSEEPDFVKTLAAKLEVLNEQYSKQNENRRKILRIVFAVIFTVSVVSLIRYVLFFTSIYQMKNIGGADASTNVTVIGGGDVPAYIPIWYYLSVLKPVLLSTLIAVASAIGFYRTRKK